MDDTKKIDAERSDLLTRIETLKKQIRSFESELGIKTEDLRVGWSESDVEVLKKMHQSEKQLGAIERLMKTRQPITQIPSPEAHTAIVERPLEISFVGQEETVKPAVPKQEPEKATVETEATHKKTEIAAIKPETASKELEKRAAEIKQKSEQIAQISSLVDKLRTDMKSQIVTAARPLQKEVTKENNATPVSVQAPQPQPIPAYSAKDLPALATLISKVNELVKTNASISEELKEIINETRNVKTAGRISDLIRRLAEAGLNG